MDLQLRDAVAIVTGSSRGLGRAMAATLFAEGCRVVLVARDEEALAAAAADIAGDAWDRMLPVALDLTEPDAARTLVAATIERFGSIRVLVNNVGGNRRKLFEDTTDDDWRELFELNLIAGLRLTREVVPHLEAAGGGSVVFVASLYGREVGGPGLSIYNASKSAVISAADVLALELAPRGIRVNSVAPGSILFPGGSWERRFRDDEEGKVRFIQQNLPLGRFGTPEEIADAVAWLASPRASLVTGACLAVDGAQGRSLI